MSKLGAAVIKTAKGEVGVKESPYGSNSGPRVKLYQAVTKAFKAPWCASFVCWCYRKNDKTVKLPPLPAYVPSWTEMVRSGSRGWKRVEPRAAQPGDIVTLWHSGHIELVSKVGQQGLFCIGGNTSPAGQNANGGMVAKTYRSFSEITIVGRYVGVK